MPGIDFNHENYINLLEKNVVFDAKITLYRITHYRYISMVFSGVNNIAIEEKRNQLIDMENDIQTRYGINLKNYMLKYQGISIPNRTNDITV